MDHVTAVGISQQMGLHQGFAGTQSLKTKPNCLLKKKKNHMTKITWPIMSYYKICSCGHTSDHSDVHTRHCVCDEACCRGKWQRLIASRWMQGDIPQDATCLGNLLNAKQTVFLLTRRHNWFPAKRCRFIWKYLRETWFVAQVSSDFILGIFVQKKKMWWFSTCKQRCFDQGNFTEDVYQRCVCIV